MFLLVANVVVFTRIGLGCPALWAGEFTIAHWLSDLGAVVNAAFAVVAALLAIMIGRRVLKRETL